MIAQLKPILESNDPSNVIPAPLPDDSRPEPPPLPTTVPEPKSKPRLKLKRQGKIQIAYNKLNSLRD